jgi:hypothetical protein
VKLKKSKLVQDDIPESTKNGMSTTEAQNSKKISAES